MKLVLEKWKKLIRENNIQAEYDAKAQVVIDNLAEMALILAQATAQDTPLEYMSTGNLRKNARSVWKNKFEQGSKELQILEKLISDLKDVSRLTH